MTKRQGRLASAPRWGTLEAVDLVTLTIGQSVTVSLDALGQEVEGTLSQIIPSADPVARSVVFKVDLPPQVNAIPGLFSRLILAAPERTALLIPAEEVVERLGITGVFQAVVRRPPAQLQHGQALTSS